MNENISVITKAAAAPKPASNSIFSHARYVVAENPVTGLARMLIPISRVMPDAWMDAPMRRSLKAPRGR